MIALALATALATADPPWVLRPEDTYGRPYRPGPVAPRVQLVVRIESPSSSGRWDYRVRYWGEQRGRGYYAERDHPAGGGRQLIVSSRECPALLTVLREVPRLRMAPLYIEGISPPIALPDSSQWRYMVGGSAEHPGGQGGELTTESWQIPGAVADPVARWARAFNRVFESCAGSLGRPIRD